VLELCKKHYITLFTYHRHQHRHHAHIYIYTIYFAGESSLNGLKSTEKCLLKIVELIRRNNFHTKLRERMDWIVL
jgi:hypothetical protein